VNNIIYGDLMKCLICGKEITEDVYEENIFGNGSCHLGCCPFFNEKARPSHQCFGCLEYRMWTDECISSEDTHFHIHKFIVPEDYFMNYYKIRKYCDSDSTKMQEVFFKLLKEHTEGINHIEDEALFRQIIDWICDVKMLIESPSAFVLKKENLKKCKDILLKEARKELLDLEMNI